MSDSSKKKQLFFSNLAKLCLKFDFPLWVLESAGVRCGVSLALLLSSRVRYSNLDKRPSSSWN